SEKSKTGCDDGIGIVYDDDNDTNAWAISPAINLSADTKYTVQVYMKAASYGDPENFKVSVATESSASALNSAAPLISQNGFSTNSFVAFSTAYTPAETGDYYFGVNCCSESMNYGLYATGFTISYMQTSGVVVTVADENGAIEYFDLQGRPVSNPTPGLYICRQGDKVTKVVVR
ncbi:MAG: hypothetical protein K2L73_04400, partial [Muribaculaceae bacterium]|nr:hypothetical protein [Muribaculaceae bacterium]